MSALTIGTPITSTGNILSTEKGAGTFSLTKTLNEDGTISKHKETTFGETTKTTDSVVTTNEDGSKTITSTSVGADGKTTSKSATITQNDDGTYSIIGTLTRANGKVISATGSGEKTAYGNSAELALTNEAGKTGSITRQAVKGEDSTAYTTTGTYPSGKQAARTCIISTDA